MSLDPAQVERAVLEEAIELHPDDLTAHALIRRMAGNREEGEQIKQAIRELQATGLLCRSGDVVAPTHAALWAVRLFSL